MKLLDLLLEEYINDYTLYGYHVTTLDRINDIKKNGFKIGHRSMEGVGFYSFYDYNKAVRYGMKDLSEKVVIIGFEILRPKNFIILNIDIAKKVFGEKYHLVDQLKRYYGSLEYVIEKLSGRYKNMTMDEFVDLLNDVEVNNKQVYFWGEVLSVYLNDDINLIYDGTYGVHIRMNRGLKDIKLLFYDKLYSDDKDRHYFTILDDIPNTEEFEILRDYILSNNLLGYDKSFLKQLVSDYLIKVKNNDDYNYFDTIDKLLDKI